MKNPRSHSRNSVHSILWIAALLLMFTLHARAAYGAGCYPRLRLDPLIAVNRTHFSVVGTIESAPVFEPTSHD